MPVDTVIRANQYNLESVGNRVADALGDLYGHVIDRTAVDDDYTVLTTDVYVGVTNTDSARTVTLPTAAEAGAGKLFIIKDESGGAGTNNVTVANAGSEEIDGTHDFTMDANYEVLRIVSDGTNWFTV